MIVVVKKKKKTSSQKWEQQNLKYMTKQQLKKYREQGVHKRRCAKCYKFFLSYGDKPSYYISGTKQKAFVCPSCNMSIWGTRTWKGQ